MSSASKTILIAEDDPNTLFLILNAFDNADLQVSFQVVEDGQEAKEYLEGINSYPDRERYPLPVLIVTNVNMPRKSGFELLAWIKQQPLLKHLPVVVMSTSDDSDQVSQAFKLGACEYLVKMSSFDDLIGIVAKLVL